MLVRFTRKFVIVLFCSNVAVLPPTDGEGVSKQRKTTIFCHIFLLLYLSFDKDPCLQGVVEPTKSSRNVGQPVPALARTRTKI